MNDFRRHSSRSGPFRFCHSSVLLLVTLHLPARLATGAPNTARRTCRVGAPSVSLRGVLSLWVAIASPVDALDDYLLTAHMVQHFILMSDRPTTHCAGIPYGPTAARAAAQSHSWSTAAALCNSMVAWTASFHHAPGGGLVSYECRLSRLAHSGGLRTNVPIRELARFRASLLLRNFHLVLVGCAHAMAKRVRAGHGGS